jgi:hypothetical protein
VSSLHLGPTLPSQSKLLTQHGHSRDHPDLECGSPPRSTVKTAARTAIPNLRDLSGHLPSSSNHGTPPIQEEPKPRSHFPVLQMLLLWFLQGTSTGNPRSQPLSGMTATQEDVRGSTCSVILCLSYSPPQDRAMINYIISLLSGKALAWVTTVWEQLTSCRSTQ